LFSLPVVVPGFYTSISVSMASMRSSPPTPGISKPPFRSHLVNVRSPATDDAKYSVPTEFKQRPGYNTTGKAISLHVNAYPVTQYPNVNIYQYDVVVGNGAEKRVIHQKVWQSKARKDATGAGIIYDGNKLAWSIKDLKEQRIMVDLDAAEGKPSRGDRNTFRLRITPAKKMDVGVIQSFLDGRVARNVPVLEAINFLDHLLREGPANNPNFVAVRRSFFARNGERSDLGGAVEVFRGVYQSLRLAEGKKMIINVDVANTTFWKPNALISAITQNQKMRDPQQLIRELQPAQRNGSRELTSLAKTIKSRFKGTMVTANYPGNPTQGKEWKLFTISLNNADEERIEWKDPQTKQPTGEKISITQYFKRKYNISLQYPKLALMEMTKKGVKFPMEFLHIIQNQRYAAKLDELQTANMIKFAVSPPSARLKAINQGKDLLNWSGDPFLQNYGLKIAKDPIKSNARLLPAPGVKFGNKTEQPGTKGRWDLRGKTFLSPNPQELVAWGVGVFSHGRTKPDKPAIDKFVLDFARAYRSHGGRISQSSPHIAQLPADAGVAVEQLHQGTGNKFNRRPQLLIFLVPDKNSFFYQRIKKSADCRFGVVSQVMQLAQVLKGNPQYYSNVLMKVNAKLGGCTSQAIPNVQSGSKPFTAPTMFIGADVSHASPGSMAPSMAALTVSFDRFGGRYAAACQTNGHRVEMISEANMRSMLGPLITQWVNQVGGGKVPAQVYYMRDGVSEGQFAHVIQQEVPHIKAVLSKVSGKPWDGKLTVVIASKRHHIRAFPIGTDAGDQKGNPVPGCLIERDVTTPTEWDFYLYSHIALQGTSRPVHYTILRDEADHKPEQVQNMIYEHCYQYMRSTTSVSLHPAVYYAHLASNRAISHLDEEASLGPQGGAGFKQTMRSSDTPPDSETKPLIKMYNVNGIEFAMWYI
jgi:eukaryotic translation initiation factor 2C